MSGRQITIREDDPRIQAALDSLMDPEQDDWDLVTDGYTRAAVADALWRWLTEVVAEGTLNDLEAEIEACEPTMFSFLPNLRVGK